MLEKLSNALSVVTLGDLETFDLLLQLNRRVVIVDRKFSGIDVAAHHESRFLGHDAHDAFTELPPRRDAAAVVSAALSQERDKDLLFEGHFYNKL